MRKLILTFSFLLSAFSPKPVFAQESITSFESKINIQPNATADVTETITYNFGTNQKHGIFREIPYIIKNQDGKRFKIDLKVLSVSDKYQVSTVGDNINIKIGDANKFVTGEKIYEIKYSVIGNVRYFSDHDEFYWNVNGADWQIPIKKISAQITLPQTNINNVVCYTGVYGSTQKNCQQNFDKNIAQFSAQNFSPGENLSIVVSFPKNIVAVVEPKKDKPNVLIVLLVLIIIILYYLFLPFYIIYRWFKYGRDPKTNPNIPTTFDPPKNQLNQFLKPAEVGTLIDEHANEKDISGTIIDLAIRGYLKIKEEEKEKYSFTKVKEFENDNSLKDFEKDTLSGIFKLGDKTTTKALENTFYTTANKIKEKLYRNLVLGGFFETSPESTRQKYYLLGSVALFTFNIFLALVCFLLGRHMPQKTSFGAQANIIALGLKKFLGSQERQLEFQSKNWFFFEKLLPYAVVFGVEKIWADRFKDLDVTPPNWYEGSSITNFNTYTFVSALDRSISKVERISSPPTSTTSSSGFSSGFSGGSSGGGGGGGGGGSW